MRRRNVVCGLAALVAGAGVLHASAVIGLTVEDQARLSELVVVGEVIGQRGVVHPVQGLETAVTLQVSETLKGDVKPGRTIVFHTRSGEVDGEVSEAIGEAVIRPGQRILVFVERVEGRRYNLGLSMGVWDANTDRSGNTVFTRALQDGLSVIGEDQVEHGPLSLDEMRLHVDRAARDPRFDNEMLRARHGQGR